ncbi:MAG: hypothetical protein JO112_20520 [Planctomycetes bacterium]|nr:hypothetical protein [Planctomycetota bacterium]
MTEAKRKSPGWVAFFLIAGFGILIGMHQVRMTHFLIAAAILPLYAVFWAFQKGLQETMVRVVRHGIIEMAAIVLYGTAWWVGQVGGNFLGACTGAIAGTIVGLMVLRLSRLERAEA